MKAMGPIPADFAPGDDAALRIGGWSAEELISQAGGTPLFVYDNNIVGRQVARFRAAMPDGLMLRYAVKANPYGPLLRFLARYVDGFGIASAGELNQLQEAEVDGLPISFAGPAKREAEIEAAIAGGVTINVESEGEVERVLAIGERLETRPKIAIRVNPPFTVEGAGMKLGGGASPFGVDSDRAPALVQQVMASGAEWRGLHICAGSQALSAAALIDAQRATVALAADIAKAAGASPAEVNLGGGFGSALFRWRAAARGGSGRSRADRDTCERFPTCSPTPASQSSSGAGWWPKSGVYLTQIIDRKDSGGRSFLITDGGLHHMLAASGNLGQLPRRNYPVAIAGRFGAAADEEVTVAGCLSTPLDVLADEVSLPHAEPGDVVAIFCAGAYGLSASPQAFLGHPPAGEMLV